MSTLHSHTHLQATQAIAQTKAFKSVCLPNRTRTVQTRHDRPLTESMSATNSTYKKLAAQWLNEALRFVSSGGRQFCASKSPTSYSCKTLRLNNKQAYIPNKIYQIIIQISQDKTRVSRTKVLN
jgi:hypothetical protein